MITAYAISASDTTSVTLHQLAVGDVIPPGTVWVDLLNPSEAERLFVLSALGIDLPDEADMEEIEASSRLYVERGTVFLTSVVMVGGETDHAELGDLTFAITPKHLITTRYCQPRSLDLFAVRLRKNPEFLRDPYDAFLELGDAIIDRIADTLQNISLRVDEASEKIFTAKVDGKAGQMLPDSKASRRKRAQSRAHPADASTTEMRLTELLRVIGRSGNITHKLRESLNGMNRLLAFVGVQMLGRFAPEQAARLKTLNRDIASLLEASNALTNEVQFLLDATLGFINIEQNNIIKIFSIAAVIFLPPTLVGTIYGMNFQHMPELAEQWGYPFALVLMFVSAILPIWYFRRRRWL